MTYDAARPLRVIEGTTGNVGRRSLHAILSRQDMELVGVFAHGADKVGVDAAELTDVPVTNAVPTVVAAAPGVVTLADLPVVTGRPTLT